MKEGILIGADRAAEELIPWWWSHYTRYNDRPITLVDFGMSKKGLALCQGQMNVISFPMEKVFVEPKEMVLPSNVEKWQKRYRGSLWQSREVWFKKPRACLLSPYEWTLWLDLDCEICGSLDPIFAEKEKNIELGIVREQVPLASNKPCMFNSGVILFRKKATFLKKWELRSHRQSAAMMGDQDVLTSILLEGKISFKELSPFYNWLMHAGVQPGILIAHWVAGWGKEHIRRFGGLHTLMKGKQKLCC